MCAKAPTRGSNNRLEMCYGRCVTDEGNRVRLSKKGHNHPPMDIDILEYPKHDLDEISFGTYLIETNECDAEN